MGDLLILLFILLDEILLLFAIALDLFEYSVYNIEK